MTAPPSRRTGIPIPDGDGARADELALGRQVAEAYGLHDVTLTPLPTPVNDVFVVTSSAGRFALKLYHGKRTGGAVRWALRPSSCSLFRQITLSEFLQPPKINT